MNHPKINVRISDASYVYAFTVWSPKAENLIQFNLFKLILVT